MTGHICIPEADAPREVLLGEVWSCSCGVKWHKVLSQRAIPVPVGRARGCRVAMPRWERVTR